MEGFGFGEGEPVFAVGCVDAVWESALGEDFAGAVEGVVEVCVTGDAEFVTHLADGGFDGFSEGVGVEIEMEGDGAGFDDQVAEGLDGFAFTDDES